MVKNGQTVHVHYVGTFDDGTEFDSSRERSKTLEVTVGSGQVIAGFDEALAEMLVGEVKNISLSPDKAYGYLHEELITTVPRDSLPESFEFQAGDEIRAKSSDGQLMTGIVESAEEDSVVLNFNHPMAGKSLNFEIELVSID
tara:strand:+ start:26104 stop:26529 length:426 start_codon:yes stop_codon:yes gene_type:complete